MIDQALDSKITAWLEENKQTILDKWLELVRIPSVQGAPLPKAPFGAACAQALSTAARNLRELGLAVKLNEEEGYAVAEYGAGPKCIGLYGHSDVVPAGDGWMYTEPFAPILRNGWMIGRGCLDNKSGVMATWCVLALVQALQIPLRNRLLAFVGSNEESGMQDMEAYVRNEPQPDLALVPDSAFPCGLGEKGILRMWARCKTPLQALQQLQGGNAFNIVLDRVDARLAADDALASQLAEKCDSRFVLSREEGAISLAANGIAKHAAYPTDSLNATWLLADLLAGCDALPQSDRDCLATVAAYLKGYWGEGLGIAHEDPDFGPLTCANGMVKVENGHLMVSLDIRYGITYDPKELEKTLAAAWEKAGWEITYLENRPGYSADPESPFPDLMKTITTELTGRDMPFYRMPGGTYGRYLKTAFPVGMAVTHVDHISEPLELPAGHGGAHQRDEAIEIEGFFMGVRILMQDILACDKIL